MHNLVTNLLLQLQSSLYNAYKLLILFFYIKLQAEFRLFFCRKRNRSNIMGEQPVQMNFSLLAYFQFLPASPILKVGLVGFLFVADVLTRTGIILSEGFGLPLFERSLEGWMFRFVLSFEECHFILVHIFFIGCCCMLGFMRLPLHHHDPPC